MKLLIFTQKVDSLDPTLGFFHTWIKEIASRIESVEVICLQKGSFDLPTNVTVYSLGKEKGTSKLGYIVNLYHYLFLIHGSYDRVFVHMNQEYVLLAGLYWKFKKIPVYFWRNHPHGGFLTRLSVFLSTKVFATSKDSFTAKFSKTVIMPVGVDTEIFKPAPNILRKKFSVCMVGRVDPVKHVEMALETTQYLISSGTQISLTIVGNPSEKDSHYYAELQDYVAKHNLSLYVSFISAVSPDKLPEIYSAHEMCLNLTETGSFDKTIVEAAACGAVPIVSNTSLSDMLPKECITSATPQAIASSIRVFLDAHERLETVSKLEAFVTSQNLETLMEKFTKELE